MKEIEDFRKYLVAIATGFLGAASSFIWVSCAPASETLSQYFGVSKSSMAWATAAFYIGTAVGFPIGLLLPRRAGLRTICIFAAIDLFIAGALRMITFLQSETGYFILIAANFVAGISVPTVVGLPTRVSVFYYPPLSNSLGICLNMMVSGFGSIGGYMESALVMTDPSKMNTWLGINAGAMFFALAGFSMTMTVVKNTPDQPLVRMQDLADSQSWDEIKTILKRQWGVGISLMFQYILGITVYWNTQLTVGMTMINQGFSRDQANAAGVYMLLAAIPGVLVVFGILLCSNSARILSRVIWWFMLAALVLLALRMQTSYLGSDIGSIYGLTATAGFFLSMISPVMFTLSSDFWHPLASIPQVFMYFMAQVVSIPLLISSYYVDASILWYIVTSMMLVVCILSCGNGAVTLHKTGSKKTESENMSLIAQDIKNTPIL